MRGCSGFANQFALHFAVFPAYAGMFLHSSSGFSLVRSFPRVCGDVPPLIKWIFPGQKFSPRMRGCSSASGGVLAAASVFPAYAGMFLRNVSPTRAHTSFPRVCGDVPPPPKSDCYHTMFSPRMRGCSISFRPAYAKKLSFPRVCGDVPFDNGFTCGFILFSPRMRGCSALACDRGQNCCVFPAYAGMFRALRYSIRRSRCFPRVCGDVPSGRISANGKDAFSPRMRGCSWGDKPCTCFCLVFPAYAGMFRHCNLVLYRLWCFPRVCGDVPCFSIMKPGARWFSPRMRGCSVGLGQLLLHRNVFPAYAGMFRSQEGSGKYWWRFPRVCGDVPEVA